MKVLIFGFYDQGNIGDDLMALMFAKLLESVGAVPVIFSNNPMFVSYGFKIDAQLTDEDYSAVLLGGGAFLKPGKSGNKEIQNNLNKISALIKKRSVPVIAASIGSDGLNDRKDLCIERKEIIGSPTLVSASVRLYGDINLLGEKFHYIPDIVLCSRYFSEEIMGWRSDPYAMNEDYKNKDLYLVNLSRRTAYNFFKAFLLSRGRRMLNFHAHSGSVGGEVNLPFIGSFQSADFGKVIAFLSRGDTIMSSKLHPGIIKLSFGGTFHAVSPREKTRLFLDEYEKAGIVNVSAGPFGVKAISLVKDFLWQEDLWNSYRVFIANALKGGAIK